MKLRNVFSMHKKDGHWNYTNARNIILLQCNSRSEYRRISVIYCNNIFSRYSSLVLELFYFLIFLKRLMELNALGLQQKIFHKRKIIAALNYKIYQMSFIPFYATQIINPFLNSRISKNNDKVERLSTNFEIHLKRIFFLYCIISFLTTDVEI